MKNQTLRHWRTWPSSHSELAPLILRMLECTRNPMNTFLTQTSITHLLNNLARVLVAAELRSPEPTTVLRSRRRRWLPNPVPPQPTTVHRGRLPEDSKHFFNVADVLDGTRVETEPTDRGRCVLNDATSAAYTAGAGTVYSTTAASAAYTACARATCSNTAAGAASTGGVRSEMCSSESTELILFATSVSNVCPRNTIANSVWLSFPREPDQPSLAVPTTNFSADSVVRSNRADASNWVIHGCTRNPMSSFLSHTSISEKKDYAFRLDLFSSNDNSTSSSPPSDESFLSMYPSQLVTEQFSACPRGCRTSLNTANHDTTRSDVLRGG